MSEVVSPRDETQSGTFHQLLISGVSFMRISPTIWNRHVQRLARVSLHSESTSSGHNAM